MDTAANQELTKHQALINLAKWRGSSRMGSFFFHRQPSGVRAVTRLRAAMNNHHVAAVACWESFDPGRHKRYYVNLIQTILLLQLHWQQLESWLIQESTRIYVHRDRCQPQKWTDIRHLLYHCYQLISTSPPFEMTPLLATQYQWRPPKSTSRRHHRRITSVAVLYPVHSG